MFDYLSVRSTFSLMKVLHSIWKWHPIKVGSISITHVHTLSNEDLKKAEQRLSHATLPKSYINNGSVYVHWPYCRQRCSYCNFVKFIPHPNSYWTVQDNTLEHFMVKELEHSLQHSYITNVKSVYFGGGTPSLARPQMIEKVLETIQAVCSLEGNAEITLEVNPTSFETNKLKDFKSVGVNRVSIGVQALDETSLRLLNRDHSVPEALHCINIAKQLFPGRVSVDLIFGRPNQTSGSLVKELETILSFCDNHISLYQLTLERGTKLFNQHLSGEVKVPSADQMADLYEVAVSLLGDSGFKRYEVSNFAHGCSAESVHNKSYWRGLQYIGIGPGAHSRVVPKNTIEKNNVVYNVYSSKCSEQDKMWSGSRIYEENSFNPTIQLSKNFFSCTIREARVNAADPANWLREVQIKGSGVRKVTAQTVLDIVSEYMASGLRTSEGITAEKWSMFLPQISLFDIFHERTLWLQESELLCVSKQGLKATSIGLNVLDSILPYLLNILEEKFI